MKHNASRFIPQCLHFRGSSAVKVRNIFETPKHIHKKLTYIIPHDANFIKSVAHDSTDVKILRDGRCQREKEPENVS
jgi:hypothetical protein